MPEGVSVEVSLDGNARITFPDPSKKGKALRALLDTGAPIQVDTGGVRKAYIVPEGNAREAGLLDEPHEDHVHMKTEPKKAAPTKTVKPSQVKPADKDPDPEKKVVVETKKTAAKKAIPAQVKEKNDAID